MFAARKAATAPTHEDSTRRPARQAAVAGCDGNGDTDSPRPTFGRAGRTKIGRVPASRQRGAEAVGWPTARSNDARPR